MKKTRNIFYLLVIAAMLLAACAPTATTSSTGTTSTEATGYPSADDQSSAYPPAGSPPSGGPGNPPPGAGTGASSAESGLATATGAYTLDGGSDTISGQTFTASSEDQSGVYVRNGGSLNLNNVTVKTTGNTSSDENSSFYGLNAGVLAASGSTITMDGGAIDTTGIGANGAFAVGSGTTVNLSNLTITATGDGGHGVMATLGGVMTLTNVNMVTSGAHSAPIATDRGGGTITATGGELTTTGQDSPCYYSTGLLDITGSTCNAIGSEAVVIEGANSITLTNSYLTSNIADKWAVMIYQSFSGDAQGSDGVFTMTGGSLTYTDAKGPLFYITNTQGHILLMNVEVSAASGILAKAAGNDRWGSSGANGGTVDLTADSQILTGDFVADAISSLDIILQNNSTLTGAINAENTAKTATLSLDASSTWNVTANSYLTCLSGAVISGNNIINISGNGHTVYYDANSCPALNGQTYTLEQGGTLTPSK